MSDASVPVLSELRDAWRSESRQHRLALAIILALGVALRLLYLAQPMRNEEAVAFMGFIRKPWAHALSGYADASNHVLYSALAKAAVGAFGPAPWAMRLPAFIAGVLIIPVTYAVAHAFYGSRAALIAAALVASSGALVLYSTNARGYGIVALCYLLLVLLATRLLRRPSWQAWGAFAVAATLGLATMPGMMFPVGAVALWLVLSVVTGDHEKKLQERVFVLVGIVMVMTVLVYAPLLARQGGGALQSAAPSSNDWLAFFVELSLSIGSLALSWALGLPPVVAFVLLLCAAIALRRHRRFSRFTIGLPLAAFVFCCSLLVVTHRTPTPRLWLWLLPLVLTLAAVGIVAVLEQQPRSRRFITGHAGIFATTVAVVGSLIVSLSSAVLLSQETGAYRDAERAVEALKPVLQPGDLVVTSGQAAGLMDYYFHRKSVDRSHLASLPSRARRVFVIEDAASGQVLDEVPLPREVRDTTRFTPPTVAASLPSSRIYLFRRRRAAGP